ncbi:MAG TPA: signal peptidase I [Patescibacteria group bacterium]|nr:signal peptidase I [Patescibacteria group bacterium]
MSMEGILDAPASPAPLSEAREIPKGIVRDYFETIVICVIFVIFARAFVFQQSKIPTGSMIPTLLIGDYIMVNKFVYAPTTMSWEKALLPVRDIKRGDIIVFKYPDEPEKDYIKRVIGLPGEFLEVKNKTVYINGTPLDEPYKIHETDLNPDSWNQIKEGDAPLSSAQPAPHRWSYREHDFDFSQVLIPENSFFCMGDNRDNSKDSRSWGFVPRGNVKGKAFIIWWSFRGEEGEYVRTSVLDHVKSIGNKLLHFPSKSRYRRCLRFIT